MRRILTLAALLALSGCDRAITEPYGPLTGTWRYTATGYNIMAPLNETSCGMQTIMVVRHEGNEIYGESQEAPYICTNPDGRSFTSTRPAGVVFGEVQDGRIHFSNAGGWHSFGEVGPDRIEGYLEAYNSVKDGPQVPARTGTFVLERISDVGFYGPRR